MSALALPMELGPHKDREEQLLRPGWELNPKPSSLITATLPTELQGQMGAGRGNSLYLDSPVSHLTNLSGKITKRSSIKLVSVCCTRSRWCLKQIDKSFAQFSTVISNSLDCENLFLNFLVPQVTFLVFPVIINGWWKHFD